MAQKSRIPLEVGFSATVIARIYGRAGRCYLALGHLTFIRSGVRSEDPCNHPSYGSSCMRML
jgi:hypothetical protein